jgi:SAM-dependent methyltransferase
MANAERRSDQAKLLREFGLGDDDLAAWERSARPSREFEDWLTDRVTRRPAGARALEVYGANDVHDFARTAILEALQLEPADRLLEIGCGGGLLLRDAAHTGARVTGLDHSEQMVGLARERAPGAEVRLGGAEYLPYPPASFTAVAMSVVFFLFPDPIAVLTECRRVLEPAGRLACYTTAPELRGTPAAPEPLASHCHFYEDERLLALAREAGLEDVVVANDDGGQLLTARA